MNVNERHLHPRDGALCFIPESHTYLLDGVEFDSVTTVIEECFEQFDADYWAQRKATPTHSAEMIKAEWAAKGEEARNLGTDLHDRIERYYLGENVDSTWMEDAAFCRFAAFAWDVRLCPFRTEWRIYHEESRLAGTLDFLAVRPDGKFEIWDWKRSSKVVDHTGRPIKENSFGKTGFSPVEHLPDTVFYHYALQVSVYRYILEEKYGLHICDAHLGIFHPLHPRYFVVDLPYLKDEVAELIRYRISMS